MNPAVKRFNKQFGGIADAIASVDIDQEDRERVAEAVADALDGRRDFKRDLFVLLASDPLSDCPGSGGEPCPHGARIRTPMHLRDAPDGRSKGWERRKPKRWCVSCGAREFGYGAGARS